MKTIRSEIASDPHALARFKQEIHLARRVTHPNVCRIFDLERHQPQPDMDSAAGVVTFLTMELLEGETLAARLDRVGPMPPAVALPLIQQMAEAVAAAHNVGVVHRDFKPGNVVLVPAKSGEAKERAVVTDFGLAKALAAADQPAAGSSTSSVTASGQVIGTVAYMAPEQLQGCEATPATDIYALGLVMYEMVTGKRPFAKYALFGGSFQRLTQPPASPRVHVPDLDPKWEQVILRCLEVDPSRRFASAGDLIIALGGRQGLAAMPGLVGTPPLQDSQMIVGLMKRHRKAVIAWMAAGMVIAAALSYALYRATSGAPASPAALEFTQRDRQRRRPARGHIARWQVCGLRAGDGRQAESLAEATGHGE